MSENYRLIKDDQALRLLCEELKDEEILSVDTEFVREKYYYPKLELVQICAGPGETIHLIDTQLTSDRRSLGALLLDPRKTLVLHAAGQDLEIFALEFGKTPETIFDTQVAASMLGYGAQISLANLVSSLLKKSSAGTQSISDWSKRPLSTQQLAYAAADVEHLHEIRQLLLAMLKERGRLAWFQEEQQQRIRDAARPAQDDSEVYQRIKEWSSLSSERLAILRELAAWREGEARRRNVPRRKVFSDEGLIDITRFKPTSKQKAEKSRRINPGQFARYQNDIQEAIRRGEQCPKEDWPKKPEKPKNDIPSGVLELCQALLRTESERQEIAPVIVAKTDDLKALITNPRGEKVQELPLLNGWRRAVAGEKLQNLLSGKLSARIGDNGDLIFESAQ